MSYNVSGKVINILTGSGVSGLLIELWDNDPKKDDKLGQCVSDDIGNYRFEVRDSQYNDRGVEKTGPDLYFKVYFEGHLLLSTQDKIVWHVESESSLINIEAPFTVITGEVVLTDVDPAASFSKLLVKAYNIKGDGLEEYLGKAKINSGGDYRIVCCNDHITDSKASPDLKVYLLNLESDPAEVVATSPLFLSSLPEKSINFRVGENKYL